MPTDLDLRFILLGPIQRQRNYPEIPTCLTDLNPRRHLALPNTDRPFPQRESCTSIRVICSPPTCNGTSICKRAPYLTSPASNSLPPPARADTAVRL